MVLQKRFRDIVIITFLFLVLVLHTCSIVFVSSSTIKGVPLWFKEGVYVEFFGKGAEIDFINGSRKVVMNGNSFFRWECLTFNGSMAKLKVTVMLVLNDVRVFEYSVHIFVDVSSRDVFSEHGEPCGKTMLWLPTNLDEGDTVTFGYPGCYINGTITDRGYNVKTPYGYQKCFEAEFKTEGSVNVTYRNKTYSLYGLWNWLDYDLDTGLLIQMAHSGGEGTLYPLGIFKIYSLMLIHETNIDIGPGLILPEIISFFWVAAPVLFFALFFLLVYYQRRKKRRLMKKGKK